MTQEEFNQMLQTAIAEGSVGGYYMSRWSGEEIDAKLDQIPEDGLVPASNPNLLDNWCFADPINQRGQTEYVGTVYGIDRWTGRNGNTVIEITDNGLTVSRVNPENTPAAGIVQKLEPGRLRPGSRVTFSVLMSDNALITASRTISEGDMSTITPASARAGLFINNALAGVFLRSTQPETLAAAKLELGDHQTLAHQDASGSWVLNDPPPNKALELATCQRYQLGLVTPRDTWKTVGLGVAATTNSVSLFIPTPVSLRANPTVEWGGPNWILFDGNSKINQIPVTEITRNTVSPNGIIVNAITSATLTEGNVYHLIKGGGASDKTKFILDSNI